MNEYLQSAQREQHERATRNKASQKERTRVLVIAGVLAALTAVFAVSCGLGIMILNPFAVKPTDHKVVAARVATISPDVRRSIFAEGRRMEEIHGAAVKDYERSPHREDSRTQSKIGRAGLRGGNQWESGQICKKYKITREEFGYIMERGDLKDFGDKPSPPSGGERQPQGASQSAKSDSP